MLHTHHHHLRGASVRTNGKSAANLLKAVLFCKSGSTGLKSSFSLSKVQAVSRRPAAADAWIRFRISPCEIYGGQSGTGTGYSPIFRVSFVSTISPLLHSYLHLSVSVTRRTNGQSLRTFQEPSSFSNRGPLNRKVLPIQPGGQVGSAWETYIPWKNVISLTTPYFSLSFSFFLVPLLPLHLFPILKAGSHT